MSTIPLFTKHLCRSHRKAIIEIGNKYRRELPPAIAQIQTFIKKMENKVPTIELVGGVKMPMVGLGTYSAKDDVMIAAAKAAIDAGYRHFDTADFYKNIVPLGQAIREAIAEGKVKREDIFFVTKIWPTWFGPGRPEASVRKQLKESGLDYFDLVLLHWPTPLKDDDVEGFPCDPETKKIIVQDRALGDIYAELEQIQEKGLARAIGLSNFNHVQIDEVLKTAKIHPTVNQVEIHIFLNQRKLQKYCDEKKIVLTAYCPLSRGGTNTKCTESIIDNPTLKDIGQSKCKSAAQVALRYLIQRGIVVIPKTITPERMKANIKIFDFELTPEEMEKIDSLNQNCRGIRFEYFGIENHPQYPFNLDY